MLKTAVGGVGAGILIAIGGCVYLACENAYVGAMLFSVALLCICWQGFDLFTGKIGYITENRNARFASALAVTLLANIVCVFLLGTTVRYALPALSEKAASICAAKLAQTYLQTFVRAAFCGVLMYLAVDIFRKKKTPLGVVSAFRCSYFRASNTRSPTRSISVFRALLRQKPRHFSSSRYSATQSEA